MDIMFPCLSPIEPLFHGKWRLFHYYDWLIENEIYLFNRVYKWSKYVAEQFLINIEDIGEGKTTNRMVFDVKYDFWHIFHNIEIIVTWTDKCDFQICPFIFKDYEESEITFMFSTNKEFLKKEDIQHCLTFKILQQMLLNDIFLNQLSEFRKYKDKDKDIKNIVIDPSMIKRAIFDIDINLETNLGYLLQGLNLMNGSDFYTLGIMCFNELKNEFEDKNQKDKYTPDDFKNGIFDSQIMQFLFKIRYFAEEFKYDKNLKMEFSEAMKKVGVDFSENESQFVIDDFEAKIMIFIKKISNTAYYYFVKEYGYNNDKDVFQ